MDFNITQIPEARAWEEDGEFYIEVPVTGVAEDRDGDSHSKSCGDSMIRQYKSGTIPLFSDHGKDANGNQNYTWKNIMGKWVDAKWADNNIDILAKNKINKENSEGMTLWKYVKEKMPVGFSIGGNVKKINGE